MAKRNIGVLPMGKTYKVINIDYCDDIGFTCQNCGKLIKNVATVEDCDGNRFEVGLDCADTLESQEISNYWEYEQKKKEYKQLMTRITRIRKEDKNGKVKHIWEITNSKDGSVYYQVDCGFYLTFSRYNVYPAYRDFFDNRVKRTYADRIEKYTRN